jgi:deoxycytidine triphosphate deaminase
MGLKPDGWIREMAVTHRMIEPFVDRLARDGAISYGLSSYGYDIRVADDFKIFTNVNAAIVDPKAFTEASFIERKADICIVPPNSFVLARSLEYFRMPADVLAVVVGKSSYARCFRGDTQVALVNGTSPTIEEMVSRAERGEEFWGYSIARDGRLIVSKLESPRCLGRDTLLELTLDSRTSVFCTPDHLLMTRDGLWTPASSAGPGTSLIPLRRYVTRGYEMTYDPHSRALRPTHRLADSWNLRRGIYEDLPGTHRHHLDHNRRNNNPTNIVRVPRSHHIRRHNATHDPNRHSAAARAAHARLSLNPEWRARRSAINQRSAQRFWQDDTYRETRARLLTQRRNPSDETRERLREANLRRYSDPAARAAHAEALRRGWAKDSGARRRKQAEVLRRILTRADITEEAVSLALATTGTIRGAARALRCDRSVFRRFPDILRLHRTKRPANHKVIAIREVPGTHDVFCLTVPEAGNFALEAGIFVHNCGIGVNCTPMEPGWIGQLTIEIANHTPLPAVIYANEGIAQVLFLQGDGPCDISYADRRGKYQGQRGITLPRL